MTDTYLHPSLAQERPAAMPDMPLSAGLVLGALIYGMMYTAGLFLTGMWLGSGYIVAGAVATAGISYLSFAAQIMDAPRWLAIMLVYGSIVTGAVTGILLLADIISR